MRPTIEWKNEKVIMIDQRKLPLEEIYNMYTTVDGVAEAIKKMVIRGAPAIGIAAAMGIALGYKNIGRNSKTRFKEILKKISKTRPTAKNLFWAIKRMERLYESLKKRSFEEIKNALITEALNIEKEDVKMNKMIGKFGSNLIERNSTILTHCNAGALATGGYGTALGVIRSAFESGKNIKVYADETRPFLQGARLTTWELLNDGIETYLITDSMAGYLMRKGEIDYVVVGADRIVSNGDVANKIGTYSLSVLAKENKIPFFVAAPYSTFDLSLEKGDDIQIEQREIDEVLNINGKNIAPEKVKVLNPAFDITPSKNISAIITDKGIIKPPYSGNIKRIFKGNKYEKKNTK